MLQLMFKYFVLLSELTLAKSMNTDKNLKYGLKNPTHTLEDNLQERLK